MKKAILFTCATVLCSNFAYSSNDLTMDNLLPCEIECIETNGTLYAPPEGSLYLQSKNDLYSFYDSLEQYGMISIDQESNTAKIGGFVFLNNFEYEVDLLGIAASILDLCTSHSKFSTAKTKIEQWQKNLIKNKNNQKLYKDVKYLEFVKLFTEIFFETTTNKLAKFNSVEFDLKLVYIDPDKCCTKTFQNIMHYIALASDKVTSIQELFVKNSFIKGKYKYRQESSTEFSLIAVE